MVNIRASWRARGLKLFQNLLRIRESTPITVDVSQLENDRILITTKRGNVVKRTYAVVFTDKELQNIDEAKKALVTGGDAQ